MSEFPKSPWWTLCHLRMPTFSQELLVEHRSNSSILRTLCPVRTLVCLYTLCQASFGDRRPGFFFFPRLLVVKCTWKTTRGCHHRHAQPGVGATALRLGNAARGRRANRLSVSCGAPVRRPRGIGHRKRPSCPRFPGKASSRGSPAVLGQLFRAGEHGGPGGGEVRGGRRGHRGGHLCGAGRRACGRPRLSLDPAFPTTPEAAALRAPSLPGPWSFLVPL